MSKSFRSRKTLKRKNTKRRVNRRKNTKRMIRGGMNLNTFGITLLSLLGSADANASRIVPRRDVNNYKNYKDAAYHAKPHSQVVLTVNDVDYFTVEDKTGIVAKTLQDNGITFETFKRAHMPGGGQGPPADPRDEVTVVFIPFSEINQENLAKILEEGQPISMAGHPLV